MNEEIPPEVLIAFMGNKSGLRNHAATKISWEILGNGLINHSYKISSESKKDFLLQRINKKVFASPENIQENYRRIWEFVTMQSTGLRLPYPILIDKINSLYIDRYNNYWRAFEFINEGKSLASVEKPEQAKAAGEAFAKFTAALKNFDADDLKETIHGFHDLILRHEQFEEALQTKFTERHLKAAPVISELKNRLRYKQFFEKIKMSGEFQLRVMHHDAKISNILFDKKSGEFICPVDFDTVMPGYYFSDLGDLIRSMACSLDENSTDFDNIQIRKEYYESIVDGYSEVIDAQLTTSEKKYLHAAGLLIIYMQALRFITDYLNGDVYYRIEYAEQNLQRAINQLTLLQRLEEFLIETYNFSM